MSNFKGASGCSKNGGSGDDVAVVCCTFGSDRIVSYRDILCDIVSYRIVSLMAVSCHHYLSDQSALEIRVKIRVRL